MYGFKTVNGMEACTTLKGDDGHNYAVQVRFQNRKRYGGMHDHRLLLLLVQCYS